jgi:hypothetical protein
MWAVANGAEVWLPREKKKDVSRHQRVLLRVVVFAI